MNKLKLFLSFLPEGRVGQLSPGDVLLGTERVVDAERGGDAGGELQLSGGGGHQGGEGQLQRQNREQAVSCQGAG